MRAWKGSAPGSLPPIRGVRTSKGEACSTLVSVPRPAISRTTCASSRSTSRGSASISSRTRARQRRQAQLVQHRHRPLEPCQGRNVFQGLSTRPHTISLPRQPSPAPPRHRLSYRHSKARARDAAVRQLSRSCHALIQDALRPNRQLCLPSCRLVAVSGLLGFPFRGTPRVCGGEK